MDLSPWGFWSAGSAGTKLLGGLLTDPETGGLQLQCAALLAPGGVLHCLHQEQSAVGAHTKPLGLLAISRVGCAIPLSRSTLKHETCRLSLLCGLRWKGVPKLGLECSCFCPLPASGEVQCMLQHLPHV